MASQEEHAWGATHAGHRRKENEDRFLIRRLENLEGFLLAVADVMGGEAGGGIAAQMVIDALERPRIAASAREHTLVSILEDCGERIRAMAAQDQSLEGMGTTATVAIADGEEVSWAHAGDSRLYLFRSGSLKQITTDHTFVRELVEEGSMTEQEAARQPLRNMLDQFVGCGNMRPDSGRFEVLAGDRLLLRSDGLTRHVSDEAIASVLQAGTARQAVDALLQHALEAGGKDNVTAVALDVPGSSALHEEKSLKGSRAYTRKRQMQKTKGELEAEICKAVIKFEKEYMGRGPLETKAYIIDDMVLVRLKNVLTQSEFKLAESIDRKDGRELIKRVRISLLEQGRPLLESAIRDILDVRVKSLHTDISTVTGERVILFTLESAPHNL